VTEPSWDVPAAPQQAVGRLSDRGGLEIAQELGDNGRERRGAIDSWELPPASTIAGVAEANWISPATARARIRQAVVELFGRDLSDGAIEYRLRTRGVDLRDRICREPGCERALPSDAPPHRLYCDEHRTPAARTQRSRRPA
jgi:hypothetical protein